MSNIHIVNISSYLLAVIFPKVWNFKVYEVRISSTMISQEK